MHAVERLARVGHRLARHLELEPLLDEAVLLLVEMTGADHAAVLTIDRGCAWIQAHHGMPDDHRAAWPRPARDLAAWPSALRGETYLGGPLHTGQEPPQWYGMEHPPRAFVAVPILHDGEPVAILYAVRTRNEPLDLRVYFLAAMDILKPNMESIRKSLTKPAEQKTYDLKTEEKKPSEAKPEIKKPIAQPRRGGFVSGWKR